MNENYEAYLDSLLSSYPELSQSEGDHPSKPEVPPETTALKLDKFSLRRGKEWAQDEIGSRVLPSIDPDSRDGLAADFLAAAWEPEPRLAENTLQEARKAFLEAMMQTPEYERLHRDTRLDEVASEMAAASFVKSWIEHTSKDEPEDELEREAANYGAAKLAVESASKDVNDLQDMRAACGIGGDGSEGGTMGADETLKLFQQVKSNHRLREIVKLSGRYIRMAQSMQRNKTVHGADEVVGIEMGDDIRRIVPSELLYLDDEDLELDFFRRFADKSLMQRELRSVESEQAGPIVLVVDESGSMSGEPIHNAKAMALAFLWIAQHQKRWACLVGFAGGTRGNYLVVPPGPRDTAGLMEWLSHFYGGGTCVDVPLEELPSKWTELGCPAGKTDIIQITDALVRAPDAMVKSFNAWKAANQVKMNTIVIGAEPGDLEKVSDRWWSIDELNLESQGVSECLSV